MSKQREALDALEEIHPGNMTPMAEQAWNKAINAIREALAEQEQQPLTDYQIREIDKLVWEELSYEEKTLGQFALKLARAIERAHGIGEA